MPSLALRLSPVLKRQGKPDSSMKIRARESQGIAKVLNLLEIYPKAHVYLAQETLTKVHHDATTTPTITSPSARPRKGISVKSLTTGYSRMHAYASSIAGNAVVKLTKSKTWVKVV